MFLVLFWFNPLILPAVSYSWRGGGYGVDIYDTSQLLLKEGSLGSTNTNTLCHHHHHHKPKAGLGPASLAAGSWGQNIVQPGTFWAVLKVSIAPPALSSNWIFLGGSQLTLLGKWWFLVFHSGSQVPNWPSWGSDNFWRLTGPAGGVKEIQIFSFRKQSSAFCTLVYFFLTSCDHLPIIGQFDT